MTRLGLETAAFLSAGEDSKLLNSASFSTSGFSCVAQRSDHRQHGELPIRFLVFLVRQSYCPIWRSQPRIAGHFESGRSGVI
jgi:hypothetical protein